MELAMNPLAVFVAAVAAFFIGFLWHGPVFGKQWMKMMGITPEQAKAQMEKGGMGPTMLAAFLQQVIVAGVIAIFAYNLSIIGIEGALWLAGLAWLGFIATTLLNGVLWEKRSLNLYLFNITYHLVSLVAIVLIVVMWK
jgi:hypothetical protein